MSEEALRSRFMKQAGEDNPPNAIKDMMNSLRKVRLETSERNSASPGESQSPRSDSPRYTQQRQNAPPQQKAPMQQKAPPQQASKPPQSSNFLAGPASGVKSPGDSDKKDESVNISTDSKLVHRDRYRRSPSNKSSALPSGIQSPLNRSSAQPSGIQSPQNEESKEEIKYPPAPSGGKFGAIAAKREEIYEDPPKPSGRMLGAIAAKKEEFNEEVKAPQRKGRVKATIPGLPDVLSSESEEEVEIENNKKPDGLSIIESKQETQQAEESHVTIELPPEPPEASSSSDEEEAQSDHDAYITQENAMPDNRKSSSSSAHSKSGSSDKSGSSAKSGSSDESDSLDEEVSEEESVDDSSIVPNERQKALLNMARRFDNEVKKTADTTDSQIRQDDEDLPTGPVRLIRIRRRDDLIAGTGFRVLGKIKGKIKVVSIIGPRDSGKTTLINAILDQAPQKEKLQPGVWMWINPIKLPEGNLIVLDMTGEEIIYEHGQLYHKIASLMFMLSSVFIFNTSGAIDEEAISELQKISTVNEWISYQNNEEETNQQLMAKLGAFSPKLIWALRDVSMKVQAGSATEYMESILRMQNFSGRTISKEQFAQIRKTVEIIYPEKMCIQMPRPVDGRRQINNDSLQSLASKFIKKCLKIRNTIYFAPIQRLNGVEMTGITTALFLELALEDLNRDKQILVMENWSTAIGSEYGRVLQIAKTNLKQNTAKISHQLPQEEGDLLVQLQKAKAEALEWIFGSGLADEDQTKIYLEQFDWFYDIEVKYIMDINQTASEAYNNSLLSKIFRDFLHKLDNGEYTSDINLLHMDYEKILYSYATKARGPGRIESYVKFLNKTNPKTFARILKDHNAETNEKMRAFIEKQDAMAAELKEIEEAALKPADNNIEDEFEDVLESADGQQSEQELQKNLVKMQTKQKKLRESLNKEQERYDDIYLQYRKNAGDMDDSMVSESGKPKKDACCIIF